MKRETIIDCGGRYEVHPTDCGWAVVNGDTGAEYCRQATAAAAVDVADSLNAESYSDDPYFRKDGRPFHLTGW